MTEEAPKQSPAEAAAQVTAPAPEEVTATKKELTKEQLESLRGVDTQLNWRGLADAFWKLCRLYKLPINVYEKTAEAVNTAANVQQIGRFSVATVPASLIVKHGSNFAHTAISEYKAWEDGNRKSRFVWTAGMASVGATVYYAAPLAASYVLPWLAAHAPAFAVAAASSLPPLLATIGTYAVGAAAMTATLILPGAFAVGVMAAATVAGGIGSLLALQAVRDNFVTGWKRTVVAWKGYKIDRAQLPPPKMEESVRLTEEDKLVRKIQNSISDNWRGGVLSEESQKAIYKSLRAKFDPAAARSAAAAEAEETAASAPQAPARKP